MNSNDRPERAVLERHLLRVSVRDSSLMLTVEIRDAANKVIKAAPARLVRGEHFCEIDLRQMPEGLFQIRTRPAKRDAFGSRLAERLLASRRKNGSTPEGRFAVLAQSTFTGTKGAFHARILCDLERRAVCLGLSRSVRTTRPTSSAPATSRASITARAEAADGAPLARRRARVAPLVASLTKGLDSKLWGGFSVPASAELDRIQGDATVPPGERIGAAWSLARWHAYNRDHDRALEAIGSMHAIAGRRIVSKMVVILEVECLCRLGRNRKARDVLDGVIAAQPAYDADLSLAYANCHIDDAADDLRLEHINEVFRRAGLATIAKENPDEPLTLGNLCAPEACPATVDSGPRISVIVPAYNSVSTIGMALESLAHQTWADIEIIVVDDCSTDGTWDIVVDLAARHDRINAVRQDHNQGAYTARNRGLELASGALITTHDADDWSHPQQIEVQARRMIADASVKASRCHWARVSEHLRFTSLWRSEETLIYPSWPSFMFGKEVKERLGAWDRVRAQADSEFIDRTRVVFGSETVVDDHSGVPLMFSLISDTSLTRSSATSISTVSFGLRQDYQDAAKWWHTRDTDKERLRLDANSPQRLFPAPPTILPDRPARPRYDLLVIGDTNSESHTYRSAMAYVGGLIRKGERVAIFHWPAFESYDRTNAALWSLAQSGQIDVISAGESVAAETVLIADPAPLQHPLDRFPAVDWNRLWVNADRDQRMTADGATFDADSVTEVLKDTFGDVGEWQPMSGDRARPSGVADGEQARTVDTDEALLSFDRDYLSRQRDLWRSGDQAIARQVSAVVQRAERAVSRRERLAVLDKTAVPPSGDRHDYMTISPYWWPDPRNPDGPQVHHRDGVRIPAMEVGHPESVKYDYTRSRYLFDDITSLALAHFFTGDVRFSRQASFLVNTWFVDPATRMNPHLRFAQVKLGHEENRGTAFGLIEFRDIHYVLDAVKLLDGSDFDRETEHGLRTWLGQYLSWLNDSPSGSEARSARNNHGPWYDLQVLAIAHYLGDRNEIDATLARARSRIGQQFESDGRQPFEVGRTLSQHYCAFNLQAWIYLAVAGEVYGVDLWGHRGTYGGSLQEGLLWLLRHDGQQWPYEQMEPFNRTRLVPLCEAYRHAYKSADEEVVRRILSDVVAPDDFANVGIRPFWRIGSPTAAERGEPEPLSDEQDRPLAVPAVVSKPLGFVVSERLRRNESFSQFLAFGFTFDDALARAANSRFVQQLAAYRQSPEPWEGLSEAEQNAVINRLLTDAVTQGMASLPPERPLTLGLSAGFDSRAILYAAHKIGVRPTLFTFGQVGTLDFDLVKILSARLELSPILFDTSEMEWSLEAFERAAADGQDLPISPRVMANAGMDAQFPGRAELNGYLNGALTGAATSSNPPRAWPAAVRGFARHNDSFRWQSLLEHYKPNDLLPPEPLTGYETLPFYRQLDFAYRQAQRIRPLPPPSLGGFRFPFENDRWVGFWLDRKPEEIAGRGRYLRFLRALESETFWDIADLVDFSAASAKRHRRINFYGTGGLGGLVDLSKAGKEIPRPASRHFCLFAGYNNNASFKRMIDASITRLRKRDVFARSFVDSVVRAFHTEATDSDSMLNGLVTADIALEVDRFGK